MDSDNQSLKKPIPETNGDVNVVYDPLIFKQREDWDWCSHDDHDWRVMTFLEETMPMVGMAICKKCALISGGFVNYD